MRERQLPQRLPPRQLAPVLAVARCRAAPRLPRRLLLQVHQLQPQRLTTRQYQIVGLQHHRRQCALQQRQRPMLHVQQYRQTEIQLSKDSQEHG